MRKLPVGIQSFEKMRGDGFAYVDKTAYVHKMVSEGAPLFLSRPRRFGKSLLVSTLRAYFQGRRELFEGLAIEGLEGDGPGAWTARPVLHLDFNGQNYTREGALERKVDSLLREHEAIWGRDEADVDPGPRFQRLIEAAHAQSGHRVAVLIDEYDKPMLDAMDDPALEERNRAALKGLYSVLKSSDEHLKFLLLTGVTKFSKVSVFSDLNQLVDISLDRDYAGVCGITEAELLRDFAPELDALAEELGVGAEECLSRLRAMYDGYCFHPSGPGGSGAEGGPGAPDRMVYNPFSLLNALRSRELGSYWFATGTPTFLVKKMRDFDLEPQQLTDGTIRATREDLADYRTENPDPVPLLYQTGYLTIKDRSPQGGLYTLGVPNGEVEWGLARGLLPAWAPAYGSRRGLDVGSLLGHVEAGDTDGMRDVIAALFASIPYTKAGDPFENYFQAVLWLVFTLLGQFAHTEIHQAVGRVDCAVEARGHVYVIELKREGTAAAALAQIHEKGYASPYAADSRQVHLVGAAFDPDTRLLADWQVETLNGSR